MRAYSELGLQHALERVAVETAEAALFNRFGQLIYREPLGRRAGYEWPQLSIHRGDLQMILLEAFKQRIGPDRLHLDAHCVRVEQGEAGVTLHFKDGRTQRGAAAIDCDGIHSVVCKQFYPAEGPPRYSGINMWRGVTRWMPVLSGA